MYCQHIDTQVNIKKKTKKLDIYMKKKNLITVVGKKKKEHHSNGKETYIETTWQKLSPGIEQLQVTVFSTVSTLV